VLGPTQCDANVLPGFWAVSDLCLSGLACRVVNMLVYTHACMGYVIQILMTVNLQRTYISLKISLLLGYEEFDFTFSDGKEHTASLRYDIASDQVYNLKALGFSFTLY